MILLLSLAPVVTTYNNNNIIPNLQLDLRVYVLHCRAAARHIQLTVNSTAMVTVWLYGYKLGLHRSPTSLPLVLGCIGEVV